MSYLLFPRLRAALPAIIRIAALFLHPVTAPAVEPAGPDLPGRPGAVARWQEVRARLGAIRRQVLVHTEPGFFDAQTTAQKLFATKGAVSAMYTPSVVGLMFQEAADARLRDEAFNRAQANYVLGAMLADFRHKLNPAVQFQGKPASLLFRRWILLDLLAAEPDAIDEANKALAREIFQGLDYRVGAQGLGNTANLKLLTALSRHVAQSGIPGFAPAPGHDGGWTPTENYLAARIDDTFYFGPDEWASSPYGPQNFLSLLTLIRAGHPPGSDPLASRAAAAFGSGLLKYASVWAGGNLVTSAERTYPAFLLPTADQSSLRLGLWPFFGGWSVFDEASRTPGSLAGADSPAVFVAFALGRVAASHAPDFIPPAALELAAAPRKSSIMAPRAGSERRILSHVDWTAGFGVYSLWSQSGIDTISIPAGVIWAARREDRGRPANFWLGVLGAGRQTHPAITDRGFAPSGTFPGAFVNPQIQRWGQHANAFVLVADSIARSSFARGPNGENQAFVTGYVPSQWLASSQGSRTEYAEDYTDAADDAPGTASRAAGGGPWRAFLAFRTVDPADRRARGLVIAVTSSAPIRKFTPDGKGGRARDGLTYANRSIFTDSSFYINVPVVQEPDRRAVGVAVEAIPLPEVTGASRPLEDLLAEVKKKVQDGTGFRFAAGPGVYGTVDYTDLAGARITRTFDPSEPVPPDFPATLWEAQMPGASGGTIGRQTVDAPREIRCRATPGGEEYRLVLP